EKTSQAIEHDPPLALLSLVDRTTGILLGCLLGEVVENETLDVIEVIEDDGLEPPPVLRSGAHEVLVRVLELTPVADRRPSNVLEPWAAVDRQQPDVRVEEERLRRRRRERRLSDARVRVDHPRIERAERRTLDVLLPRSRSLSL